MSDLLVASGFRLLFLACALILRWIDGRYLRSMFVLKALFCDNELVRMNLCWEFFYCLTEKKTKYFQFCIQFFSKCPSFLTTIPYLLPHLFLLPINHGVTGGCRRDSFWVL